MEGSVCGRVGLAHFYHVSGPVSVSDGLVALEVTGPRRHVHYSPVTSLEPDVASRA
jgi:hypothetical protein